MKIFPKSIHQIFWSGRKLVVSVKQRSCSFKPVLRVSLPEMFASFAPIWFIQAEFFVECNFLIG